MLAVVVHHRIVEGIDPLEIFRIQNVLSTYPVSRLRAQIGLEQPQDWTKDRQARQPEVATLVLKPSDQRLIEQGVKNNTWRFLNLGQHTIKLPVGTHRGIDMLHWRRAVILRGSSARDRDQRFAGGVRDEMKMKEARIARQHRLVR